MPTLSLEDTMRNQILTLVFSLSLAITFTTTTFAVQDSPTKETANQDTEKQDTQKQEPAKPKDPTAPQKSQNESKDKHNLRPPFSTEELLEKSEVSIQNGLDFLVKSQNKDGSWGSHDPKLASWANLAFSVRKRGSHDAVRTACTAICAHALLDQENRTAGQQKALENAIAELTKVRKFAYEPGTSFNTWGYGYKLAFLLELNATKEGENLKEEIKKAAQSCVEGLKVYQQHTGGWSYYAGPSGNADNMSFNTSLFALSLDRAKKIGCEVPKGMVLDATRAVERMRAPNGNFAYDSRFETHKNGSPLKQGLGGGSRTMAATHAMFELGNYSKRDLKIGLQVFYDGENYLESGRKLLQPHTAPHQISGYFFFFGYNYATAGAEALGDEVSQAKWDRFGWTMLRTQEKDGKWWDTAWGDYGEKWGTGFAVQTLQRYIRETKRRNPNADTEMLEKAESAIEKSAGGSGKTDQAKETSKEKSDK